jgi:hypothetical protein
MWKCRWFDSCQSWIGFNWNWWKWCPISKTFRTKNFNIDWSDEYENGRSSAILFEGSHRSVFDDHLLIVTPEIDRPGTDKLLNRNDRRCRASTNFCPARSSRLRNGCTKRPRTSKGKWFQSCLGSMIWLRCRIIIDHDWQRESYICCW